MGVVFLAVRQKHHGYNLLISRSRMIMDTEGDDRVGKTNRICLVVVREGRSCCQSALLLLLSDGLYVLTDKE